MTFRIIPNKAIACEALAACIKESKCWWWSMGLRSCIDPVRQFSEDAPAPHPSSLLPQFAEHFSLTTYNYHCTVPARPPPHVLSSQIWSHRPVSINLHRIAIQFQFISPHNRVETPQGHYGSWPRVKRQLRSRELCRCFHGRRARCSYSVFSLCQSRKSSPPIPQPNPLGKRKINLPAIHLTTLLF